MAPFKHNREGAGLTGNKNYQIKLPPCLVVITVKQKEVTSIQLKLVRSVFLGYPAHQHCQHDEQTPGWALA